MKCHPSNNKFLSYSIIAAMLSTALPTLAENLTLFTGSQGSKGIHTLTLDTETGSLSTPRKVASESGASFICTSPNKKFLFATASQGKSKGGVASYSILPDNNLKLISTQPTLGKGATHVSIDKTGTCLFSVDYGSGHLTSYKVDSKGAISPAVSTFDLKGSSIHPSRQTSSHAHSIYSSHDNKHVYSADLGTDKINIYSLNQETAELTPVGYTKVPAGSGPRHLALHPNGKYIYALNELTCTISTLERTPSTGTLKLLHTISVLPEPTEGISCSEIHLTPNNKHLYTGNRGVKKQTRNSISFLTLPKDLSQKPKLAQNLVLPIQVHIPRHINITPSGEWLIATGQKSDPLAVIKRDLTTGKLTLTNNIIALPRPACIIIK